MSEEKKPLVKHTREEVDKHIHNIIVQMTSGQWTTKSHVALAKEAGVDPVTVRDWSRQASRIIRVAIGEGEEIRTRLIAHLEDIHQRALDKKGMTRSGDEYDNPDLKAAVSAIDSQARLLGLVTEKHEVNITVAQFATLTLEHKIQVLDERIAQLQEAKQLLLTEGEAAQ